jgi:hypothetical protein
MRLKDPRPLHAGLVKGSSDLVGWTPVKITPEMVGKTIAVFTAPEVKDRGKASDEQKIFIGNVEKANGITGVIRSTDDYDRMVKSWLERNSSLST